MCSAGNRAPPYALMLMFLDTGLILDTEQQDRHEGVVPALVFQIRAGIQMLGGL